VEKSKNEIEYMNSEKERSSQVGYSQKIEAFTRTIQQCEKRTKDMKSELTSIEKVVKG